MPTHPQPHQPPMPAIAAGGACVLLHHELPEGSWHVDWMMEKRDGSAAGSDEASLITFRLRRRVDELAEGEAVAAERIADHRRAYLQYEGEVSGGRGRVRRLAQGEIIAVEPITEGKVHAVSLFIRWRPNQDISNTLAGDTGESRGAEAGAGEAFARRAAMIQRLILEHDAAGGERDRWNVRCVSRGFAAQ